MRRSANLYPWDVDGDPAAAGRIAGLGLTEVTLAAAYHSVRAVTPYHPRHRIVTRAACAQAYAAAGADPAELRAAVRSVADQVLSGHGEKPGPPGDGPGVLPEDLDGMLLAVRAALAQRFLREVIAAVRDAAPGKPVLVHAHPDARAAGAPRCRSGAAPERPTRPGRGRNPARRRGRLQRGAGAGRADSAASRATCSEERDSAEPRLTPSIRSMCRSRS